MSEKTVGDLVFNKHFEKISEEQKNHLLRTYSISEMAFIGGPAYQAALKNARREMFVEIGANNYSDRQVFDYAMEQEFLFGHNGNLENR